MCCRKDQKGLLLTNEKLTMDQEQLLIIKYTCIVYPDCNDSMHDRIICENMVSSYV